MIAERILSQQGPLVHNDAVEGWCLELNHGRLVERYTIVNDTILCRKLFPHNESTIVSVEYYHLDE
jgi:hypothetical protein